MPGIGNGRSGVLPPGFSNWLGSFARVRLGRGTIIPIENHRQSRNEAIVTSAPPQASAILACLGQATFVWDLATDMIAWSEHLASVFPDIAPERLATGTEYAKLIEPAGSVRTAALTAAAHRAEGVACRIEYGVRASTSHPLLWIEESGCWFAGAD